MLENITKLKSYAKINLYLNIVRKLDDGYHNIESIMQTIDLFDDIYLKKTENPGIFIECNDPEVPVDNNSIIYQAAEMLIKNIDKGITISINKRIPLAAGLGGGSSNIATILIGISRIFGLKFNSSQLLDLASHFGMDVPFFMVRGTVLAKGKGDLILPLKPIFPTIPLILVNPGIKISTKWAYQLFDKLSSNDIKKNINIAHFLNQNKVINPSEIYKTIYNSFDSIISEKYPIIEQIKNRLKNLGSVAVTISGSGSTVYGIFKRKAEMNRAYHEIKNAYPFVFNTQTVQAHKLFYSKNV